MSVDDLFYIRGIREGAIQRLTEQRIFIAAPGLRVLVHLPCMSRCLTQEETERLRGLFELARTNGWVVCGTLVCEPGDDHAGYVAQHAQSCDADAILTGTPSGRSLTYTENHSTVPEA
ncbi:hypothetical protein [Streptomyces sp. NPDC003032]